MGNKTYTPDDVRRLYEAYLEQSRQLDRKRRPTDGYFGLGSKPSDDPCHDRFAKDLEKLLNAISVQQPESAQAREILEYVYFAPLENQKPLFVYWMLVAVHGLTLGLIDRLNKVDADVLWRRYKKNYPRWEWLPAQKKAMSAMKARR